MDLSRIYTKTSRGILDGALKTRAFGREHARLLVLIDGKSSLGDLLAQNTRLSENRLAAIIDKLADAGLIRLISEVSDADDLGFSSTIIVSEANTQAFFDAQIAVENKVRRAEDDEALAQDLAREILLKEVAADITAEAEALKRQNAEQPVPSVPGKKLPHANQSNLEQSKAKVQARAEAMAHAKAIEAEANARAVKTRKIEHERQETQTKIYAEMGRIETTQSTQATTRAEESTVRETKQKKERLAKESSVQERRKLEAKILAEEEAQRNADLDAHFLAIERASIPAQKKNSTPPKALNQSDIAAELETRVKRRLEARAREEAEATQRQAEVAAKLEAEQKARLEAEQKAQAEAEARAKAEILAQAVEAAQRRAQAEEAAAKLEAERKARLAAEQKAQAEAEARAKAEAEILAQAKETARQQAVEAAQRQAEAAAKLEAERKAYLAAGKMRADAQALAEKVHRQAVLEEEKIKRAEEQRALAEVAQKAQAEAEAMALAAAAEEAVRRESAALKRQMEERQREDETRRVRAAAELEIEAERQARALMEATAQTLADERAQIKSAALAREQEQIRARKNADAKAHAEMEEALRREQDALAREKNEETRLRNEAQVRALAAAKAATLPIFAQHKRKPLRYNKAWNKSIAIGVAMVLLLAIALVHLLPFNFYIPKLEQQLSDSLGQRVTIQTLHFSVYPAPHLELDGVLVGDKVGARIEKVSLFPVISTWFSAVKRIRRVELDSVSMSADSLGAFPLWSRNQARVVPLQFEQLLIKNGKFSHPLLDVFAFNADIHARQGRFIQAKIVSTDQRIDMNLVPQGDALRIDLKANQSVLPFEPRLPLETLKLTAVAQAGTLSMSHIEAQLFDGYITGTAQVSWVKGWTFKAELNLQQIAMAPSLARFTRGPKLTGTLEAKVRLAGQAQMLEALFESPQAQATFRVKNGDYTGIDLVRAIQAPSRGGQAAGKTHFNDLSGYFQLSKGRYIYRQIKLQGGVVSATGRLEVNPNKSLSGNLLAELHTPSARFRSSFVFAGDLQEPVLKAPGSRSALPVVAPEISTEAPTDTGATQKEN